MAKYKRVLVKLSGEALAKKGKDEIFDATNLNQVALALKSIVDKGVQVSVVVGGGNIWRGKLAESIGVERSTADYMGMLGTIINALALQSALNQVGVDSRVMSAIEVRQVCEPYIKLRAIRHLEKGRIVIFGGGTGSPYFTTDTTAALRANDINCDAILMAKNGVDGVYTSDPRTNKDAKFISNISYKEMLDMNLQVMDRTAVSLCMDTNIELRVFNMNDTSNFIKVIEGENIGTTIRKEN
ncbi:MAG: UMP kinase [Bacilli bacterium]|nr:UMP kinase [Bacillales bacterium]MDY2574665.1 UMP kinase [Bacilli bacterium]